MSRQRAVVSRNQAFTRFLPGAVETIDGETVIIQLHEITAAAVDPFTRDFLREQLRTTIAQWQYSEAVYRQFLDDATSSAFEFVNSVRLIAYSLPVVECRVCKAVSNLQIERGDRRNCHRADCRGPLRVLPFIEVHNCGARSNVRIPSCPDHGNDYIILERHAARRWSCGVHGCDWHDGAWPGYCGKGCYFQLLRVPVTTKEKRNSQVLVGSNSVYRVQSIDILNPPQGDLGRLFRSFGEYVAPVFLCNYLSVQEIDFNDLEPVFQLLAELRDDGQNPKNDNTELDAVVASLKISDREKAQLIKALGEASTVSKAATRAAAFKRSLDEVTLLVPELAAGTVPWKPLKQVYDLSLALSLHNASTLEGLLEQLAGRGSSIAAALEISSVRRGMDRYALREITLVNNFPIVSCAYGYTRGTMTSENRVLRAFPKRPSVYGGKTEKTPFYMLSNETEALVVELAPHAVLAWLRENGLAPEEELEVGSDSALRAWTLRQFFEEDIRTNPRAFAIFCLVHSYAHRMIEQIALESCFSATSLSEMIMPGTFSFIIYVNQRSEFNIGGLSSFVEQRLSRALNAIIQETPCIFDPICTLKESASCNGCLFLPEVTCREFNDGLTRTVLYGGQLYDHDDLSKLTGLSALTGLFAPSLLPQAV